MNRLVLLLVSLISTSSCIYMIGIGVEQLTILSPGDYKGSYFYVKADRFRREGKVYLLVKDQGSGFEYNNFEICYTDEDPSSNKSVKNCDFKRISYYAMDKGDGDEKNYYYKFNYVDKKDNIFRENIIAHFERKYKISGILTVKSSTLDIYKEKKEKESRIFSSIFQMILIFVGLLILLAAIIIGIVFFYSWYKKKKFFSPQLKEKLQPNLETEFPENSPLGF